ncbi:4-hydroxy-2-oxoglutarate aldolase @ 2-dehydro-3-deoxyphosphogluconate aldolase [hydrothermal vent metagenome]|uniref:2-dehydro-3-deoxy-phosphogluconate aldolase n=1 Tax=hydrothermal vent metagenome TaxID=652676 RepID=A0A3B0TWA6_9ZZZZ
MIPPVEDLKKAVRAARVIPVMVLDNVDAAIPLAEALVEGGLNVLEVTLRTPNALKIIKEMARVKGAIVGSGTVRNLEQMRQSEEAGCSFMVSPGAPIGLLEAAKDVSIPLLPGIASPSEAMTAADMGYSFLKFFPAEAMGGPNVLKAMASPFPDLSFCPTGGISLANAPTYLNLPNVICVGGSWITPHQAIAASDFALIRQLAREVKINGL